MWGLYLVVKTSISAGLKIMDYVRSFVLIVNCFFQTQPVYKVNNMLRFW